MLRTEPFAWPSVADIIAGAVAQGDRYLVYTLSPGLTVETDVPLRRKISVVVLSLAVGIAALIAAGVMR